MNAQERDQLKQFLNQMTGAQLNGKDPEAEAMIKDAVIKQPDAAYLLVQRSMLLEQALDNAKQQILQMQSNQTKSSFLGGSNPWAQPNEPQAVPGIGSYQPPRAAPSSFANPLGGVGGGSSFLGNIATTAAGVVAGSFLFQGIESLMGHHSSPWGGGGQMGENFTENTTINNYYESDRNDNIAQADDNYFNAADDDYSSNDSDDSSWV